MAKKKATKKAVKKKTTGKGAGRPLKYTDSHKETMLRLAPLGYNNKEICKILGCSEDTFYRWMKESPELSESLEIAKDLADSMVIQSLFDKALGRCVVKEVISGIDPNTGNIIETTKTKEIPPSDVAIKYFLNNRRPDKWKEKNEIEAVVENRNVTVNISKAAGTRTLEDVENS